MKSSTLEKIEKDIINAIDQKMAHGTAPYDTEAQVVRIDGDTAWVHIPGGVAETPVALTINAQKGDKVQVRVSNGKAWIVGNATAPPTDDAKANEADAKAVVAKEEAGVAKAEATVAKETADAVHGIAVQAQEDASEAMATANAKNTVYRRSTQPPSSGTYAVGDLWFDTANDNKIHRYDGTTWVEVVLGDDALDSISADKITAGTIDASEITVSNIDAGNITSGNLDAERIKANVVSAINATANKIEAKNINASQITIGQSQVTDLVDDLADKLESSDITVTQNQTQTGYDVDIAGHTFSLVNGEDGDDGTSVTVVSTQYQEGVSATTAPTGAWSDSPVSVTQGNYLWTKVTYSDSSVAYSIARQGTNGTNGTNGTSVTVSSVEYAYQLSSSGDTVPTGTWSQTPVAPTTTQYAWTRTTTTFSDTSTAVTYTVGGKTGTNGANGRDGIAWYAECPTAAATTAKVATITPATTEFTLTTGVTVNVKFANTNSGAVGSLTLNVNGTGAKSIKYDLNGNAPANIPSAGYLRNDRVYQFIYNGTYWVVNLNYNTNDTDRNKWSASLTAAAAITSGRLICGTSSGFKQIAAGVSFDLSYPILYAASAISSGSTGNNNWLTYGNWDTGINFSSNGTITGATAGKAVYLKGTVNGSTFTIASSEWLTCTVPATKDGYVYMPLGTLKAGSTTNGVFNYSDKLYAYKGGKFQEVGYGYASAHITEIGNDGIKVHDENDTSNYAQLNSSGMQIYQNDIEIASFGGSGVVIGQNGSSQTVIENDGISFLTPDGVTAFAVDSGTGTKEQTIQKRIDKDFGEMIPDDNATFKCTTQLTNLSSGDDFDITFLFQRHQSSQTYYKRTGTFGFKKGTTAIVDKKITFAAGITCTFSVLYDASDNEFDISYDAETGSTGIGCIVTAKYISYEKTVATARVDAPYGYSSGGAQIGSFIDMSGDESGTMTLKSSYQQIPMTRYSVLHGNAFYPDTEDDLGIYMMYDGLVLIWGRVRLYNSYTANDMVIANILHTAFADGTESSVSTVRTRVPITAPNHDLIILPSVKAVRANDMLTLRAYNNNGARGTVTKSACTLRAVYLGPYMESL